MKAYVERYRELFPAVLTGMGTAGGMPRYAWTEVLPDATGEHVVQAGARGGTTTQNWARELNDAVVPTGGRVWMRHRDEAEGIIFEFECCGGGGTGTTYSTDVGDGTSNTIVVTHDLGSTDLFVTVRQNDYPYEEIHPTVKYLTADTIELDFETLVTTDQYHVTITTGGGPSPIPTAQTVTGASGSYNDFPLEPGTPQVTFTTVGATTITGLDGPPPAGGSQRLTVTNSPTSGYSLTLSGEDGASTAGNRIWTPTATSADLSIPPGGSVDLIYDPAAGRWVTTTYAATTASSLTLAESPTPPATPPAGYAVLYVDASGDLFILDSAGASTAATYTDEQAQDSAAAMIAAGTHTGIAFTYSDSTNALSATVTATGGGGPTEGTLAALGSTQGTAAAITTSAVKVTGADGTKGVILPNVAGTVTVWNSNASFNLKVYPNSGATINNVGTNVATSMTPRQLQVFFRADSTQWTTLGGGVSP